MKINYDKIEEIYGYDCLLLIKDNIDDVISNIEYVFELGFEDVLDIFERYPYIFLVSKNKFKEKVDKLIIKIGVNYVNIIENDLDLLGELE